MIDINKYIQRFKILFPSFLEAPWHVPGVIEVLLNERIKTLSSDFNINGSIAIHKTAIVEQGVIMKGTVIIGPSCFIGAHAYMRGGIFLDEKVVVGPGCEVKSSMLFSQSALAHFNFVGDSLVGERVNMEAGSIIANHYNERQDKTMHVLVDGLKVKLPVTKFGAIVGDGTRIGANAVLSPATVLERNSVVKRLELVEQIPPQ